MACCSLLHDLWRIVFHSKLINAVILAFALWVVVPTLAQARALTPQERTVCASLKSCLDIVRRHDSSEFDYAVLETEFRRFGGRGQTELLGLLKTENGQADIAKLVTGLGPLTVEQRRKLKKDWSIEKAEAYLPLLLDGQAMSRDLLLQSLAHPVADVREQARRGLLSMPKPVQTAPLPSTLTDRLLSALAADPIDIAAPYLSRLNVQGREAEFTSLLGSGEPSIVTAAYAALYRNSPSRAFNGLLAEMETFDRPAQSRAIGEMLAIRNASRADGFYLKFAQDMSGDPKLSIPARASGLHGLILMKAPRFPDLNPARSEALAFLAKDHPFAAQDLYISYLKAVGADDAMGLIWDIAETENWINRDRLAKNYSDHPVHDRVVRNLLQSPDIRSFRAGLSLAKPAHQPLILRRINDPVGAIANAARQKMGQPLDRDPRPTCRVKPFDLEDLRAQMPFFDDGWTTTPNRARVSLSRSFLTTAHPTASGWLAGYDISGPRTISNGGAVLHYDNASGEYKRIGDFYGPVAILPERPLKLGETTSKFWLIYAWGGDSLDISAYIVDVSGAAPVIRHVAALPYDPEGFALAGNGDLIVSFSGKAQAPIRLSKSGRVSSACSRQNPTNRLAAPQ